MSTHAYETCRPFEGDHILASGSFKMEFDVTGRFVQIYAMQFCSNIIVSNLIGDYLCNHPAWKNWSLDT
jgi:hypothetical protein